MAHLRAAVGVVVLGAPMGTALLGRECGGRKVAPLRILELRSRASHGTFCPLMPCEDLRGGRR